MADYLTPAEVAAKLGVTEHSVRRWMKEGTIKGIRIGGRLRVPLDFEKSLPPAAEQTSA